MTNAPARGWTLNDFCAIQPGGRYLLSLPASRDVGILAPQGWKPKVMSRGLKWVVGSTTTGTTFPGGTHFNLDVASGFTYRFFAHELAHWWQSTRRMGRGHYLATYLWHGLLTNFDHGHHVGRDRVKETVHRDHMMEDEARTIGDIVADLLMAIARDRKPAVVDFAQWCTTGFPARRAP